MSLFQHLTNALFTLWANKLRSSLTMLGIIIGVASVIIMVAIGQGAQSGVEGRINQLGTNLLTISSGGRGASNVRTTTSAPLTPKDLTILTEYFNKRALFTPESSTNKQLIAGTENTSAQIRGVLPTITTVQNLTIAQGRFFTEEENTSGALLMLLGNTLAETLFTTPTAALGQSVRVGSLTFTIIGTLADNTTVNNQALIPLKTAQLRITGSTTTYTSILTLFADGEDMTNAKSELTHLLATARNTDITNPNFTVINRSDFLSTLSEITTIFTLLLGGIAGISLIVGGIGVMNIMLVSVTERTREIGIRKALGAKKSDILLQFLIESATLALLGGTIGIILALAATHLISQVFSFAASVTTPSIILAFAVSAITGILFGYLPALRASRLRIIEALRYE